MKPAPVVWQPVPALPYLYAIESDAPHVLDAARQLFAPWLVEAGDAPRAQSWTINADDAGRWNVVSDANRWHNQSLVNALTQVEYAAVLHLVSQLPPDFVGLHGALLSRDFGGARRAVVIVGPKEAGKSTLACALWRAGWTLHCDDFTLLDARGRAHPSARRVSLREGSRALLGGLWEAAAQTPSARTTSEGLAFHPHEIDGEPNAVQGALEVGAICFLKRRDVEIAPAQAALLGGIEAAFALLPYSTLVAPASATQLAPRLDNWGLDLATLSARIRGISLYDVGRAQPAAMVAAIEKLIEAAPPPVQLKSLQARG